MNYPTRTGYYWWTQDKGKTWTIAEVRYDELLIVTVCWMGIDYVSLSFAVDEPWGSGVTYETLNENAGTLIPLFFKHEVSGEWGPQIPEYIPKVVS